MASLDTTSWSRGRSAFVISFSADEFSRVWSRSKTRESFFWAISREASRCLSSLTYSLFTSRSVCM